MPVLTCNHASCEFTSVEEGSLSEKLQHLHLLVQTALKMKARQCSMRLKCSKSNCREMVDYSTDIVKNHCVNVLIKLNLAQSILYKPIFFKFRIKEEHFV